MINFIYNQKKDKKEGERSVIFYYVKKFERDKKRSSNNLSKKERNICDLCRI